jgi:hypothetical protein
VYFEQDSWVYVQALYVLKRQFLIESNLRILFRAQKFQRTRLILLFIVVLSKPIMLVQRLGFFRMPAGEEKFVSIADLKGWGYSNSDIRGYLAALSILQV